MTQSDIGAASRSDEQLAQAVTRQLEMLQVAIHEAVEAGLRVELTVEHMHKVGKHYPEPLIEVNLERIVKLT